MRKIFINYRRTEAEYTAGALGRELRRYFGDEKIFRDKEDIGGGAAWKQRILDEIDRDSALLVLIGKDWADIADSQGRRRLDNPSDPLRLEIADGLKDGAAIVPILLENAAMPEESELPGELRRLAEHNALRLRDSDWHYDLGNICKTLEKAGFEPIVCAGKAPDTSPLAKKGVSAMGIVGAIITALVLLAIGSDDLDHDGHLGAAVLSGIALVLGIFTWRESWRQATKARILGIAVSTLAALGLLAAVGGMDSPPVSPIGGQPTVSQPNHRTGEVQPEAVAAPPPTAEASNERTSSENSRRRVATRPGADPPATLVSRESLSPQPPPAQPPATPSHVKEKDGLSDAILGAWRSQIDEAIEGGRIYGDGTDQYFRNGTSVSTGRMSLHTRFPNGVPFAMTWQLNATGEWSLHGRQLTEKIVDIKSFVTEVRVNGQTMDVATIQREMNQMGQSLPTLESFMPRGMSTESEIVAMDPTGMTLRTADENGKYKTTVYQRVVNR